jgi:hypothetical protein
MQKIIEAEKSDLFDVLAHVAYALPTPMPTSAEPTKSATSSRAFRSISI